MRRIEPLAFTCAVNPEALSRWRGLIGGELNSMCVTTLVPSGSKDCSIGLDGPHCISILAPSMSPEFEIPKLSPKTDFIDYGEGVFRRAHARALTLIASSSTALSAVERWAWGLPETRDRELNQARAYQPPAGECA